MFLVAVTSVIKTLAEKKHAGSSGGGSRNLKFPTSKKQARSI
jgi:hypothetical protein